MMALCPEDCATAAHVHVDCTTMVRYHRTSATLAHDCLGGATAALCPEGRATMAHGYVGGTTVVPCH